MLKDEELVRIHRSRAEGIINLVLIFFALIVARLWYLQIYKGKVLYRYSLENRLRKDPVPAPRGMIFSRNNKVLTFNVPRFDVIITPQYLKNRKSALQKLSQIIDSNVENIEKILKKKRGQAKYIPVVIKKNIDEKEVAIIETENSKMPGISVRTFISREYVSKDAGGHLLGYIKEISERQLPKFKERDSVDYKLGDFIGQSGVEEVFDRYLRGKDGFSFMEVDALGRMKRHVSSDPLFKDIKDQSPKLGNNIRLTVDFDMQMAAYAALEEKVGALVAIDVSNGDVLSMVSRPSFDPTNMAKFLTTEYWNSLMSDPNKPLRDRTVQDHYSPGSTFKTISAIAALEEGIVTPETKVHCPGYFKLGRRFRCWRRHGHGEVDIYKSLQESCDVYYYKIATKLDIDVLAKYARMFGFGAKTRVNVPRETAGLIPSKEWKLKKTGTPWQLGETLSCIIGQSYILATPIQLALSYSAIANGGKLYRPQVVREVFSNSGNIVKKYEPKLVRELDISKKTLDIVKKALFMVPNTPKGTAWWYRGRGIKMAGKTGTTQVMRFAGDKIFMKCEERPYKERHHGLYVAFAPADDPKIAVSAVVEHGCHGSSAAAPVVAKVIQTYMSKYYPEKYKEIKEWDKTVFDSWLRKRNAARKAEKERKEAEEHDEAE